jgi:hypothetical protein
MDRAEFEAFRTRHRRIRRMIWSATVLAGLGIGYAVGLASSLLLGAVVTVAFVAATQPLHLRWDRARWLKRFPELAEHPGVVTKW